MTKRIAEYEIEIARHENLKNFFYRLLGLEKAKTSEELAKNFYYLSRNETNPSNKAFLKNVLQFVFNEIYSYDKDVYQKILENLESGGDDMFLVDVLIREKNEAIEEGRKEGILENIRNVATEMLRQNFDDTTIIKTTKIDTETLKKLKESIA